MYVSDTQIYYTLLQPSSPDNVCKFQILTLFMISTEHHDVRKIND